MSKEAKESAGTEEERPKVLVLEDDFDFAEMLSESLEAAGFQVGLYLEPAEAAEAAADPEVQLVVSDIQMPKQNGEDFVRQIRVDRPDLPVILISAYTRQQDLEELLALGVNRVMRKPFKQTDLLREIEEVRREVEDLRQQRVEEKKRLIQGAQLPEHSFPDTQGRLPVGHLLSLQAAEGLWAAFQRGGGIFLSGPDGMELEPVLGALRVWAGEENLRALEVRASDLFDLPSREMINRLVHKGEYGSFVVVQNLAGVGREVQTSLSKMLAGETGFFRAKANSRFVFTVEAADLADSEIVMEERLLEVIYRNLVTLPPLEGRFSDIAHYVRQMLEKFGMGDAAILTDDGMAFLLQYNWPGNYAQLAEVGRRLVAQYRGQPVDRAELGRLIDKTRRQVTDFEPGDTLEGVLLAEQRKIFLQEIKTRNLPPEGILKGLGVDAQVIPPDFPNGLPLLYPDLLREIEE